MATLTLPAPAQQIDDSKLYQQVSERIAALIDAGTLRPGQRVPSVRKLSQQLQVSVSTVLEAYRRLEDRGLIEARPQSGYYVRPRLRPVPAEPEMTRPAQTCRKPSAGELIMHVVHAARDPNVVPLGAAVSAAEFLPMRQLTRIMGQMARRHPQLAHGYDFPPGNLQLRTQVARRALDAGCTLRPSDIITTCGSQEAITLCLRAVTKPGDVVALETPTYYGLLEAVESLHLKALEIPTHPREGVCLDSLASAIRRQKIAACLFVTNYNNPLGSAMPDPRKKQLVELLAKREIPLIEDDIYGELAHGPQRLKTCKSFDKQGLVLLCSSFSKTLAPGFRVGWCAPGRWFSTVERLKFISTIATPSVPQMAVAEFLANGGYDHHIRKIRRTYAELVQTTTDAITRYFPAGTKATRPAGGFVLWIEFPKRVDSLDLHRRALAENISIAPGPIFSPSGRKYANFIRLNCGHPWSEAREDAMRRLGKLAGEA
jgi:DNA-binding transcriptional MocR family regulator